MIYLAVVFLVMIFLALPLSGIAVMHAIRRLADTQRVRFCNRFYNHWE